MTLEIKKNLNETSIRVVGRLDSFTTPVLEKMISKNSPGAECIVLDLSGVESVSEAGLKILLDVNEKIQPASALKLTGVKEGVMNAFITNGCVDAFAIN